MELTPKQIVKELDRFIIGQHDAKVAVAIALRNRYRRSRLPEEMREEITPKNILMKGPTGVGKTEIARRLARLVRAPFVKVEATKFTEVGYVGRDVESIIRDLVEVAIRMVKEEKFKEVMPRATEIAENKLVDVLEGNQNKLGIRFKQLYRYELDNFNDLKKVIKDYNSIARRRDQKKIDLDDYLFVVGRSRYLDFGSLMKALDFNIFREVRMQESRDCREFFETVRENIDNGVPLCWSTFIIPGVGDTNSSEFGMHMRIITGYNDKTGEIIFSDSWGAGHEKKSLKNEDAWSITVNLVSLEPRRK